MTPYNPRTCVCISSVIIFFWSSKCVVRFVKRVCVGVQGMMHYLEARHQCQPKEVTLQQ